MTREQAKQNLIACGIAEPTDEQITAYLNQVNGAVKVEKDRAEKLKADADKAADLQKQLDEINSKGLSDVEKANKSLELANSRIAELEKSIKKSEMQKKLAELGITGESADKFFNEAGEIDFENLGKILSDKAAEAATNKEKELAGNAGNPGGTKGNGGEPTDLGAQYAEAFNARYAEK